MSLLVSNSPIVHDKLQITVRKSLNYLWSRSRFITSKNHCKIIIIKMDQHRFLVLQIQVKMPKSGRQHTSLSRSWNCYSTIMTLYQALRNYSTPKQIHNLSNCKRTPVEVESQCREDERIEIHAHTNQCTQLHMISTGIYSSLPQDLSSSFYKLHITFIFAWAQAGSVSEQLP